MVHARRCRVTQPVARATLAGWVRTATPAQASPSTTDRIAAYTNWLVTTLPKTVAIVWVRFDHVSMPDKAPATAAALVVARSGRRQRGIRSRARLTTPSRTAGMLRAKP
jgi:hypothetical protein